MPPVVNGQEAFPRPGFSVAAHPRDTITPAALHFHHVRERVVPPAVAWFQLNTQPALALGASVVACLLQTERVHTEHGVIAGHTRIPERNRTRDSVPQHAGIASEEVDLMPCLKCQPIARVIDA